MGILMAVVGAFLLLVAGRQAYIFREFRRVGDALLFAVLAIAGLGCFALAAG